MANASPGSLYGMLDTLILKTLSQDGPLHGLAIARRIAALSDDFLSVEEGALYPALHRLAERGLIEGEWRISKKRRRAKFYSLTPAGAREVEKEVRRWVEHTSAVRKVLDVAWSDISGAS